MVEITFDGVNYVQTDIGQPGCDGCAFNFNSEKCMKTPHCGTNEAFIMKEEEELKMNTNIKELIKEKAIFILERELSNKFEYNKNDLDTEVDEAINEMDIDIDIIKYVHDCMYEIDNSIRRRFAEVRKTEQCNTAIKSVRFGTKIFITDNGIKDTVIEILEDELLVLLVDNHFEELEAYYMSKYYQHMEENFPIPVNKMVRSLVSDDVDKFINSL